MCLPPRLERTTMPFNDLHILGVAATRSPPPVGAPGIIPASAQTLSGGPCPEVFNQIPAIRAVILKSIYLPPPLSNTERLEKRLESATTEKMRSMLLPELF
eukprot:comp21663_c0_seq1/m.30469 comp21663_c0_seq1/g.30469  ORF comp21663_c0_seq1/g.30469 comp21663_c0_seq1/m.30469 type:complete len:101 (-) comp21663_c0_seq1:651-953(-)